MYNIIYAFCLCILFHWAHCFTLSLLTYNVIIICTCTKNALEHKLSGYIIFSLMYVQVCMKAPLMVRNPLTVIKKWLTLAEHAIPSSSQCEKPMSVNVTNASQSVASRDSVLCRFGVRSEHHSVRSEHHSVFFPLLKGMIA